MEKLKGFDLPTPHKGPVSDGEEQAKEFSIFHQAYFLFKRQDEFMTEFSKAHDYAAINYEPSGTMLTALFSKLRHAAAPTMAAMLEKRRNAINKKFAGIATKIRESLKKNNNAIPRQDYTDIHQDLFEVMTLINKANQECGMGIPKDWKYSERGRIVKSVKDQ